MAFRIVFLGFSLISAICIASLWQPVYHRATVLGFTRSQASIQNSYKDGQLIKVPNTVHCEDLHYHHASNMLYTACEGDARIRKHWFPPIGHMQRQERYGGKIVLIDPTTFESTSLHLSGFNGPLITHGIDLFPSPDGQSLTIFAVNHLPNPSYTSSPNSTAPKARSQIEIFTHAIGSSTAIWLRSVAHPAIRTPNDIFATSATSFYVTNDHHYREGFLRRLEDLLEYHTAAWSDVVHISFTAEGRDAVGVNATIALDKYHNPNGLGHSNHENEVLLTSAAGGELYVLARDAETNELTLRERIQMDSTIDNPSYYADVYATPGRNASGYILAGLLRAGALVEAIMDDEECIPSVVWHVRGGERRVLFSDQGARVRSASAAVVVGIDPAENGGRKEGWLFVTGFVSEAVVAVRVDLE